jgi:hypothetical protein
MFLLFSCPNSNVHACWEMNLIQQRKLNFHICILCLNFILLALEVNPTSSLCFTITLTLGAPPCNSWTPCSTYNNHSHTRWTYWLFDHSYKEIVET